MQHSGCRSPCTAQLQLPPLPGRAPPRDGTLSAALQQRACRGRAEVPRDSGTAAYKGNRKVRVTAYGCVQVSQFWKLLISACTVWSFQEGQRKAPQPHSPATLQPYSPTALQPSAAGELSGHSAAADSCSSPLHPLSTSQGANRGSLSFIPPSMRKHGGKRSESATAVHTFTSLQ